MRYQVQGDQLSYGEAIGILLIENYAPYIPGDVANATSYAYPVRFERLVGVTHRRLFEHDRTMRTAVMEGARRLAREGVRAITADCGFLAMFQEDLAGAVELPVFLSSLMQLDFIARIIGTEGRVGIITANRKSLTPDLIRAVSSLAPERLEIVGMEDKPHFVSAVFEEEGMLDSELVEREVIETAATIMASPKVKAILLECSLLPPYAASVRDRTGLPVFDYLTMIDYVHQAVVPRRYVGHM
jgi:Asp/Glu/hydantoin racemase